MQRVYVNEDGERKLVISNLHNPEVLGSYSVDELGISDLKVIYFDANSGTLKYDTIQNIMKSLDDSLLVGGYRVVDDVPARNNIPLSLRKEGMLVRTAIDKKIYELRDGNWVELLTGKPMTFTQNLPSDKWVINHGFGYRPIVNVFSIDGELIHPYVLNVDLDVTEVYFSQPEVGSVTLK